MTAVEQFFKDLCDLGFIEYPDDSLIQDRYNLSLEKELEQNINLLTEFQIFMNENDCITDYDWDFERMAKKFLNSKKTRPMTVVEWLKERLPSLFTNDSGHYKKIFNKALIMEKEQIKQAQQVQKGDYCAVCGCREFWNDEEE